MAMRGNQQVIYVYRSNAGVVTGVFGCVFGVLGVFTMGIIFVPLAALFSLIGFIRGLGLFRGLTDISGTGMLVSLVGGMFAAIGFAVSPSVWLLVGLTAFIGAHDQILTRLTPSTPDAFQIDRPAPAVIPLQPKPILAGNTIQNYCTGKGTTKEIRPIPTAPSLYYICVDNQIYLCKDGKGYSCNKGQ